jgi:hypothetical protein
VADAVEESLFTSFAEQSCNFRPEIRVPRDGATSSASTQRLREEEREKRTVAQRSEGTSAVGASQRVCTVFQNRLALHDLRYRIEVCRIAERVDQDQAIQPIALFPQIGQIQTECHAVCVQKDGLHASGRNRLPHNRVREDGDADAGVWR